MQEHGVLLRHYGELQRRCSAQARCQRQEIEQLQAQVMRLRAGIILRDSMLAWECEDRQQLLDALAAPPEQAAGARREDALPTQANAIHPTDPALFEQSLRYADLVICQTGCISHGAFWRVADHCKRTGKTCVLVQQPQALSIVHSHSDGQAEPLAAVPACEKDTQ